MKRGWIWGGFGALLLVGISSGFVPDLKHAAAVRDARADGLLQVPVVPKVPRSDDARPLYTWAQGRYPQAVTLLMSDFKRQVRTPAPHVAKYLNAVRVASKKPACSSWVYGANSNPVYSTAVETQPVMYAARAMAARAQDAGDLETVGRVARHIVAQPSLPDAAYAAAIALDAFDRADALGLDARAKRRIAAAFGPMPVPRKRLAAWIARLATAREAEKGMSAMRRNTAFLVYWHGILKEFPQEKRAFATGVAGKGKELEERGRRTDQWTDYTSVLTAFPTPRGSVPNSLAGWTALLDKADRRIEAAR